MDGMGAFQYDLTPKEEKQVIRDLRITNTEWPGWVTRAILFKTRKALQAFSKRWRILEATLAGKQNVELTGFCAGDAYPNNTMFALIGLNRQDLSIEAIAHECCHLGQHVLLFDLPGMKKDGQECREQQAEVVGNVTQILVEEFMGGKHGK